MTFSALQIAALINGKTEGNANISVHSFGKIEEAGDGQLAFLANPKYEEYLYSTRASVIIINEALELKQPVTATLIRVADAYTAFAKLLSTYQQMMQQQMIGIQQPVYISSSASYGENVFIGAFAYLSDNVKVGNGTKIYPNAYLGNNVKVGDNSIIHAGVKIYHDCVIGNNVIIHAGTVIGSDGFGFAPQADGSFQKVPQIGNVIIENNVEIGANTTIDRATIGSTIIRSGAKLDNLIQIAHNVEIGNSTVIAAQTGISGSVKVGKGVMIGGQVGFAGHINIGDGVKIGAQSGISKNLPPGKSVWGSPAFDVSDVMRSLVIYRNLPAMEKRIKELEELVKQLMSEKIS